MSSAPTKAISWLAGTRSCRASSGKRFKTFATAGPPPWGAASSNAIGADIASSYITPAAIAIAPSARPRPVPAGSSSGRPNFSRSPISHVVFTLPPPIGRLALQNQKQIYTILFRAASQTLLETAADPRLLGASIGFLAVLHTWGQNLHLHPHLHCIVPGGGLSPDGSRWIACRKSSFFLPVRLLSRRFRKTFLRHLRLAFGKAALRFSGDSSLWRRRHRS